MPHRARVRAAAASTARGLALGLVVVAAGEGAVALALRVGRRVLNAAISSYGTVRELMLLGRRDSSRLRHLIIQYGYNDHRENRTFLERGELPISERQRYRATVERHRRTTRYFPGKHLAVMARLWHRRPAPPGRPAGHRLVAERLLEALLDSPARP